MPPTEHDIPLLKVKTTIAHKKFDGSDITYSLKSLAFNDNVDTPMIVKVINGDCYAVLMREHLFHVSIVIVMIYFLFVWMDL